MTLEFDEQSRLAHIPGPEVQLSTLVLDNTISRPLEILIRDDEAVRLRCGPAGNARRGLRSYVENPSECIALEPTDG